MVERSDFSAGNPFLQSEQVQPSTLFDVPREGELVKAYPFDVEDPAEAEWWLLRKGEGAAVAEHRPAREDGAEATGAASSVPSITDILTRMGLAGRVRVGFDWLECGVEGRFGEGELVGLDTGSGGMEILKSEVAYERLLEMGSLLRDAETKSSAERFFGLHRLDQKTLDVKRSHFGEMTGSRFMKGNTSLVCLFKVADVEFALARREGRGAWVGMMTARGERMTRYNGQAEPVMELLAEIFGMLGVEITGLPVQREDLCADFPGMSVDPLARAVVRGEVVSRMGIEPDLKIGRPEEITGCTLGKGRDMSIVFYDKELELLKGSGTLESRELKRSYLEEQWGGTFERVMRLEIKMRGSYIRKRFGRERITTLAGGEKKREVVAVRDLADVVADGKVMVRHLLGAFFRIVQGRVDRKNRNQHKAKELEVWAAIREAFVDGLPGGEREYEKPEKREAKLDKERAARVMRAWARNYLVAGGLDPDACSLEDMAAYVIGGLSSAGDGLEELREEVREKRKKYKSADIKISSQLGMPRARWSVVDNMGGGVPF